MNIPIILNTNNPILVPAGVIDWTDEYGEDESLWPPQSNDSWSVTDPWVGQSSTGTYYILYSGVTPGYNKYSIMLASSSSLNGPWEKLGTVMEYDQLPSNLQGHSQQEYVPGGVSGCGNPYCLYYGDRWHLFFDAVTTESTTDWQIVGERIIAHYTNICDDTILPVTGWVLENSTALVALTTGWTSDGLGHPAGVCTPKVYPHDGGGWVMFMNSWGFRIPDPYGSSCGYALSDSLNGPWILAAEPMIGSTVAQAPYNGLYQAEQPSYFKSGTKHLQFINRSGLTTHTDLVAGNYDVSDDLWISDNQTGPYSLVQLNVIPSQSWFTNSGVISVVNPDRLNPPDIDEYNIRGIFAANSGATFKIGAFTVENHWLVDGVEHWLVDGVEHWLVDGVEHWLVDGVEHFAIPSSAITPPQGTYPNAQSVTFDMELGLTYLYSIDGSDPLSVLLIDPVTNTAITENGIPVTEGVSE